MNRVYFLFIVSLLVACSHNDSSVQFEPPEELRQIAAYTPENLYVIVRVNGGDPQRFVGPDWTVNVQGVTRNAQNTLEISWFEVYNGNDLLLARQTESFFVGTGLSQFTPATVYESEGVGFDCDNDGISNLVERRQLTDPCVGDLLFEPDMVAIEGGCFDMGAPEDELEREPDEGPLQTVCVAAFEMSRFEATFNEYDLFADATSRTPAQDYGWGRGILPVLASWFDATAYAQWLSETTGKRYRLPTEAEWEYAARAGTTTAFSTGVRIEPRQANYDGLYSYNGSGFNFFPDRRTVNVGTYQPNPFGLYDMHGNVWEWTCSRYEVSYAGQEQVCEDGTAGLRAARGGSWFNHPKFLRSAKRNEIAPQNADSATGFRVVREIN